MSMHQQQNSAEPIDDQNENIEHSVHLGDEGVEDPRGTLYEKIPHFKSETDQSGKKSGEMEKTLAIETNTNDDKCEQNNIKSDMHKTVASCDNFEEEDCSSNDTKANEQAQSPGKELPDWFKVMIGLTHGIHDGKEMKEAEDIAETIDIHGSTQAITVKTNERLFQLIMKRLHRITRRKRRACTCTPDFDRLKESIKRKSTKDKEINSIVENLLEPLVEIDDVNVSCEDVNALCHKGGVPVLHIRCSSCQSLYRVVTALNSPVFKDGIIQIRDCLEHEMKDKLDIDANITPASIQDIQHHLREQGIITDSDDFVSCGVHPDQRTEVYCFQHNDICCTTCVESQHRSCDGVQHVEAEEGKRPVIIGKVKEYNVRLHTENTDDGNCDIIACCALPTGEIILADMNNKRLKKLNTALKIIDHCDLPDCPRDICYFGNNKLAVSLFDPGIQFVDISGKMKLQEKVPLDHDCYGITSYGDTLYVTDPMSVFMYNFEGQEKGVLYKQIVGNHSFCKIAISEDGEKLYIAARDAGMVTIDREGNCLSSLRKEDLRYVSDICVADDGSVLTCNYRKQTVSRVDCEGKILMGRVAERSDDMYMPQSLCYDRYTSRLIVGHLHDDYISVLDLK